MHGEVGSGTAERTCRLSTSLWPSQMDLLIEPKSRNGTRTIIVWLWHSRECERRFIQFSFIMRVQ